MNLNTKLLFLLLLLISTTYVYSYQQHDDKVLNIAFAQQNITLNFHAGFSNIESQIHNALYSGLVITNPSTLQPSVGIAISWFANEDNTEYTFNIRNNATFSDGSTITAQDIKDSWLAAISNNSAFAYLFDIIKGVQLYRNGLGTIQNIGITSVSDNILTVTLEQPTPYFLKVIAHSAFSVTKSNQTKKQDWDSDPYNIPFSGPFVLENYTAEKITLKKNDTFWAKEYVKLDKIIITFYTNEQRKELIKKINAGEIHWTTMYIDSKEIVQDWININQIFGTKYLFFRTENAPWDNEQVRSAIRLMLPLKTLRSENQDFPAHSLIPQIQGIYTPPTIAADQNIEKSLDLLEKAGYPNGNGLDDIVLFVPSYDDGEYENIFDTLKTIIENNINISVNIKTVPSHEYHTAITTEDFTIALTSWIGDFADPAAFLQMWASPNPSLGQDYDNQHYRETLSKAYGKNETQRETYLQNTERILLESTVIIPLHHLYAVNIIRNDLIKGWNTNPLDTHQFGAIQFKPLTPIPYTTTLPLVPFNHNIVENYTLK